MKLILSLMCLAATLSVAPAVQAQSLSFIPLDHWSYQAFDRLASLGLLPLHTLASKPITRREARSLLEEASTGVRRADPAIARLAREDLRRLSEEFSVDSPVAITASGAVSTTPAGSATASRPLGGSAVTLRLSPTDAWALVGRLGQGGGVDASRWTELYASFQLGAVLGEFGKVAPWWSPSPRSSLLLSDNAGSLPALRLVADFPRVRLTKVVAFLERTGGAPPGDVVLFATRLDWAVTPSFRLGLNETVITTWGAPLTLYHLIQPLPVFSGIVASYGLHDALGQSRNMAVAVDFDWLMRPGIRWYGSALIDDAPEHLGTRAKVGLLVGLQVVDPFRTGRTSLRLEYSAVSNGTYAYGLGLEQAYRGRSLGHWLGPDGDDLFVELTHQLNAAASLQLWYAFTRHGEGRIGQPAPPARGWFLSGVVERRHTVGLQLQTLPTRSVETRYTAEVAAVTNRGNVAGANGWEGVLRVELTYRPDAAMVPAAAAVPPAPPTSMEQPSAARLPLLAGALLDGLALRSWTSTMTSRGPLSGPETRGAFWGVAYRTALGTPTLALTYDATGRGQVFWSADLHYPLAEFGPAAIAVFAGAGGLMHRGELGGTIHRLSLWGPRLGASLTYRIALNSAATPIYLTGEISSPPARAVLAPVEGGGRFALWTYDLGVGWRGQWGSVQAGYRGAAASWRDGTPDQTYLRWGGFYLALQLRR